MGQAARRWAEALAAWAIPPEILAQAPDDPWGFPTELFRYAAERALVDPDAARGPSRSRALEALPPGGTVLDVGAGGGAASLPLAPPAGRIVAVDESEAMLKAFATGAEDRGVDHEEIRGRWPDVAPDVPEADVVVCHHVFYNAADLVPFAEALTSHARARVVVELSAEHPQTRFNPLWKALHGVDRPTDPTADDAAAVLREIGIRVQQEWREATMAPSHWPRSELVRFARRRLCAGPDRDAEVDALLPVEEQPRRLVTLWWETGRQR